MQNVDASMRKILKHVYADQNMRVGARRILTSYILSSISFILFDQRQNTKR